MKEDCLSYHVLSAPSSVCGEEWMLNKYLLNFSIILKIQNCFWPLLLLFSIFNKFQYPVSFLNAFSHLTVLFNPFHYCHRVYDHKLLHILCFSLLKSIYSIQFCQINHLKYHSFHITSLLQNIQSAQYAVTRCQPARKVPFPLTVTPISSKPLY